MKEQDALGVHEDEPPVRGCRKAAPDDDEQGKKQQVAGKEPVDRR